LLIFKGIRKRNRNGVSQIGSRRSEPLRSSGYAGIAKDSDRNLKSFAR
jgi:hypothetical protein